ncbi:hypothetical protein GCM10010833_33830 [Blastomonas aquatica]|uniref:Uncharacterized protein n=1 Tax=Blastomonas aquatica TaxID=1510276 RepID=A0ABQ1JT85_9SPHN|nr:hypothetical protein GCM10010833_33830 [Blastomonas aquatica]
MGLGAKPLSDMIMDAAQGLLARCTTVRGWRSCFRDFVAETTNFNSQLTEMAVGTPSRLGSGPINRLRAT